jgi:hypothetical protein
VVQVVLGFEYEQFKPEAGFDHAEEFENYDHE